MGVLTETNQWETTINQIEVTDPALGGANGPVNTAPRQLANRTQYLKAQLTTAQTEIADARGGKATLAARLTALETQTTQGDLTYAGAATGVTDSHSLGHTNYTVNIMPTANTNGDLGDVFVSKASNAFTVYNTGGFRGQARYQIIT